MTLSLHKRITAIPKRIISALLGHSHGPAYLFGASHFTRALTTMLASDFGIRNVSRSAPDASSRCGHIGVRYKDFGECRVEGFPEAEGHAAAVGQADLRIFARRSYGRIDLHHHLLGGAHARKELVTISLLRCSDTDRSFHPDEEPLATLLSKRLHTHAVWHGYGNSCSVTVVLDARDPDRYHAHVACLISVLKEQIAHIAAHSRSQAEAALSAEPAPRHPNRIRSGSPPRSLAR